MAQARIWTLLESYRKQGRWVEALIWVHDALTAEAEHDMKFVHELNTRMVAALTESPKGFSVPICTSGDWGLNWADMEPFHE